MKAGAFDSLGARRAQLHAAIDRALQTGSAALADRRSGQKGLFDDADDDAETTNAAADLPDIPEWDSRTKQANEKEVLGFYLGGSPLDEHENELRTYSTHTTAAAAEAADKTEVYVGGMLSALKYSHTKQARNGSTNTKYVMFDLEDKEGMLRCILWPEQFSEFGHLVSGDAILMIRGAIQRRAGSDECNLICNELIPMSELAGRYTRGVEVRLDDGPRAVEQVERLYEIARGYPGTSEFRILLSLGDGNQVRLTSQKLRIKVEPQLCERMKDLLGTGRFHLLTSRPKPSASNGQSRRFAAAT
jgi:DNA polymerase-3 subunit alpha